MNMYCETLFSWFLTFSVVLNVTEGNRNGTRHEEVIETHYRYHQNEAKVDEKVFNGLPNKTDSKKTNIRGQTQHKISAKMRKENSFFVGSNSLNEVVSRRRIKGPFIDKFRTGVIDTRSRNEKIRNDIGRRRRSHHVDSSRKGIIGAFKMMSPLDAKKRSYDASKKTRRKEQKGKAMKSRRRLVDAGIASYIQEAVSMTTRKDGGLPIKTIQEYTYFKRLLPLKTTKKKKNIQSKKKNDIYPNKKERSYTRNIVMSPSYPMEDSQGPSYSEGPSYSSYSSSVPIFNMVGQPYGGAGDGFATNVINGLTRALDRQQSSNDIQQITTTMAQHMLNTLILTREH